MELNEPSAKYLGREGYKQTELGTLPVDWEVVHLGKLDPFVTSGSRGWARHYSETGSTFLRITNLSRDSIYPDLSDLRYVRIPADDSEGERTKLANGDVLLSITADVGIVGYVSDCVPTPAFVNQHIALVRFAQNTLDSKYLCYFLASSPSQQAFRALADAGAKAGMNLNTVLSLKVALPPTSSEQNAISEALTNADALIESLEQLLAKKRQIKQGTMQELLTGQRRLPGFGGEWVSYAMGQLARITMGRTPSRIQSKYWGHGYKWLSISDLKGRTVADSKEEITAAAASDMEVIPAGTLLMSFKLTLGRLCFAGTDLFTNEAICAFRDLKANPELVYYALQRVDFSLVGKQAVKGYTLNKESLAAVSVLLPSDQKEQTAIATILSDMDTEITALEARLSKARHLKQGMAQALLTGRIRLQLPDAG